MKYQEELEALREQYKDAKSDVDRTILEKRAKMIKSDGDER